jgi:hypothetical protein
MVKSGANRKPLTPRGTLLLTTFRQPANYEEFFPRFYAELINKLPRFKSETFHLQQVYETIKNAAAHGGDCLIAARRYQAVRHGQQRKIIEVIVWDNGPGLKRPENALINGYTSNPDRPFDDFAGQGKGIDLIVGYEPTRYAADELIIDTGRTRIARKHSSGQYHFSENRNYIRGTKVTLRFWT